MPYSSLPNPDMWCNMEGGIGLPFGNVGLITPLGVSTSGWKSNIIHYVVWPNQLGRAVVKAINGLCFRARVILQQNSEDAENGQLAQSTQWPNNSAST